jgi:hypothetical protein
LERVFGLVKPKRIVVATDQHRIGRLAVTASHAPANVVVLQHGLPQTPIAFLPLVADRICVWSEGARSWFVRHGTPSDRIVALGNPRMDDLARLDRDVMRQRIDAQHGFDLPRHLLVALSPLDTETNLAVLEITLRAARADQGLAVIVKLHPGRGEERLVRKAVREASLGERVKILQREPLVPLLLWADAVCLFRSTVGLESAMARTPVIVAEVGPTSIADDELVTLDLPRASEASSLVGFLAGISRPGAADAYFAERHAVIERMAGPSDGASARRIASYLLSGDREITVHENGSFVGSGTPPVD